jgi:outer membrane protein, heavy metal efflux system
MSYLRQAGRLCSIEDKENDGYMITCTCSLIRYGAVLALVLPFMAFAESTADLQKLSIEQAIRIAMEHNHDVRLSDLAVAGANAASVIASASPNPMLTVQTANINPSAGIGAGRLRSKTVDSSFRVDQLIERGDKRVLRMENAANLEKAARHDLQDAYRQVRLNVQQAYYDVLAAEDRLVIARQTKTLYAGTVAAAQKRQKAGDLANADVARLQVDALRSSNDVAQTQTDLVKARQTLAMLLGQRADANRIRLCDTWPSASFDAVPAPLSVVEQRTDVLAAKARLDAAIAARKLALALRTRDVSIGVQYEHWPASAGNGQGTGNSYGIAVQIPLFVRYAFDGEIRAAATAVDTARETFEKVRDLAYNDIYKSWEDTHGAYERVNRYDKELLGAAKKSADAAEFAFRHGAISVMDVLDARRTYHATQLDALAAHADYAKSLASWQAAVSESTTP